MKNLLIAFCIVIFGSLVSCKKTKDIAPTPEEILTKKISDILPQKYVDTLTKLGLNVNNGTTPPNIVGAYIAKPFKLKESNIEGDVPGMNFTDGYVKFFDQSTTDFGIKLVGKNLLNLADTSVTTAISGSGNNFTVYGKVKSTYGSNYAYFAILLSGVKEGNTIKNLNMGILNIDNQHGGSIFIAEGQGRVAYDTDLVSESINFEAIAAQVRDQMLSPGLQKRHN
jgi:hypothetical protein